MNNNGGSRFFDGFLLGVVVGAIAVFLFGSKSPKKIVKTISEEGLEGFQNLVEEYKQVQEEVEDEEDSKPDVKEESSVSSKINELKPKKRFFRRFKRVD